MKTKNIKKVISELNAKALTDRMNVVRKEIILQQLELPEHISNIDMIRSLVIGYPENIASTMAKDIVFDIVVAGKCKLINNENYGYHK